MVCATLKSYLVVVVVVIVFTAIDTRWGVEGLNVKDFLGSEPLTPRLIVEELLEYFQQEDPRGIPILNVPEVLEFPGEHSGSKMTLTDVTVSGHSNITLEYVEVDLEQLQAQIKLNIPLLETLGEYEWPGFWSSSKGNLTVSFVNLDFGAKCHLGVSDDGFIQVIKMEVIFDFEQFLPVLTGLILEHKVAVGAADTFFGSLVLPIIQDKVETKGMAAINQRLVKVLKDRRFPVDISPVDFIIAKLRSDIVERRNLEPLRMEEKDINYLSFSLTLNNIELRGLSTLHRSEVIKTFFVDNRIYVTIEMGTQELLGSMDWALYSTLFPVASGQVEIRVEGMRVSLEAQQEVDVRHPPILRRIDIELGNVALRSKGERNLDYILEAVVNYLPNILRNTLMDRKVECLIKKRIQERFNAINLEHIIYEQLNKMEKSS